jgi:predicted O-methyltransferase YrrM
LINRVFSYTKYLLTAKGKHGIHSPFVYDLLTNIINNDGEYYAFEKLERLRQRLLNNHQEIEVTDFGAGGIAPQISQINTDKKSVQIREISGEKKTYNRKISDIARHSLQSEKYAKLLFRLVNHFQPKYVLELGTSLGLTTLYQAIPIPYSKFITLEGCPNTAAIAQENFIHFKQSTIKIIVGNFDETLSQALKEMPQLDYVFFDGNHRYEPTMRYFKQCMEHIHEGTVFIFDDIHWSKEMEQAWNEIRKDSRITISIDLFKIGIVFFRKGQVKQDFVIRF